MAEPADGPREWTLLGWGMVGGAHLAHLWRYHPPSGLLQSRCQLIMRQGNPLELLHPKPEKVGRCKQCERKNE